VVGSDEAGRRVRDRLESSGIESRLETGSGDRPTTVKTRIIAHSQQVVRADREKSEDISPAVERRLLKALGEELASCEALVISDYEKGTVTASVLGKVLPLARRRRVPILVDPKLRHFRRYRGVTVVTPNQVETEQATGLAVADEKGLLAAGRRILSLLRCRAALVTRGEHGLSLFERGRRPVHVPAAAREVFDVTGAGDSVIATLALALAGGATLAEAAGLANLAAGVVVGKVGTAQATPKEVLAAHRAAS
jgi:D-beta-D-heptose 7-phosphate kinase/D-beta-D-heptose 1-phosphate adenosyltransferase